MAPRLPLSILRTSHSTTARVRAVCGGKMKIVRSLAAVAALACFPVTPSQAESDPQDAVIVTATRTALSADNALAPVTIITRQDIERSQAQSVAELIQGLPGIGISVSGGHGKQTSVFLRGTGRGHVLLLIDGVKSGSATDGAPAWEFLPVSEIDRIEIVRGPRSSLYGSEALGGVIQIFTRKGKGPAQWQATAGAGSRQFNEIGGGVSGSYADGWYSLHVNRFATRGFDARQPVVEFGTSVDQPDRDGLNNRSMSARWGYRFDKGTEIELHALRAEGNTEFDAAGNDEEDFVLEASGAKLQFQPAAWWNMALNYGRSLDHRRDFQSSGSLPEDRFNTTHQQWSWQNDLALADAHLLTLGYDYSRDRVGGTVDYARKSRDNRGIFGQYQAKFEKQDASLSLRHDTNEQFGGHNTGNATWGYALAERLRLIASYGTAFRAPTFNDLYFPDFMGFPTSNPNLQPEKSRTSEIGLKGHADEWNWSLFGFYTKIENLIALDAAFIPQNVNSATIKGIETEAAINVGKWKLQGGITLLDPRDEETDNWLAHRSRKSAKLDVNHRGGDLEMGVGVIARGPSFDDAANTKRLGGYSVIDLHAQKILAKDWRLRARIENLLNKEYQTVQSYNSPSRGFFITLAYQSSQP
jgi:vitamin B12 transporter